jgi:predicted Zn-dependent protease
MKNVLLALPLFVLLGSCAKDPVTGKRELVLVSEVEEIQMGSEAARETEATMGVYPDEELNAYVERLGLSMAQASERPDLPWRFRVIDSPVVNAFALPGGYIYLTRGILAYLGSEAALVGVMGHEIGHVTARHHVEQMSKQQLAGLGVGLGTVFFPEVRPFGDLLGGSLSLLFLKFGRDAERESDRLGVTYSLAQGYDPDEMARFFGVLDRLSGPERNIPSWASTHPDPGEREQTIRGLVAERVSDPGTLKKGRDVYLRHLEGLVFGENPREGFTEGRRFIHPELRFELEFPEGWRVQNSRQAVFSAPPDGAAALQLTLSTVPEGTTPDVHARDFFRRQQMEYGTGERIRVGPFDAYRASFRVLTRSGEIYGEAGFIADGTRMYELVGFTRPNAFRRYSPVFRGVIASFDRLRDRRLLDVQPLRVHLLEARRSATLRTLLNEAGVDPKHHEDLELMNDIDLDETVESGTLVKILRQDES